MRSWAVNKVQYHHSAHNYHKKLAFQSSDAYDTNPT